MKLTKLRVSFWVLFALAIAGCIWFLRSDNPLLGKWVVNSGFDPEDPSTAHERGYEFFRSKRFVTFGYEVDGHKVDRYGKYSLVGSNRVRLELQGIYTLQASNLVKVPMDKQKFPLFSEPAYLLLQGDMLEEEIYITAPTRLTRKDKYAP